MTAKNILSPRLSFASASAHEVNTDLATAYRMKEIDAETPIIEVLQHFADCADIVLPVSENGQIIGYIDSQSLIDGLCKTIVARDDSSIINLKCSHHDYSASAIAMAVEDADAHLVDMFSSPSDDEKINVCLRVRHFDPTAAANSLRRHGFEVVSTFSKQSVHAEIAAERLAHLAALLNV